MKIKVNKIVWSGWNGGSSTERYYEYDVCLGKEIVVSSMEVSTLDSKGKEDFKIRNIFSFKVVKVGKSSIKMLVNGEAGGGIYLKRNDGFKARKVKLLINEIVKFSTKRMDCGETFELMLES